MSEKLGYWMYDRVEKGGTVVRNIIADYGADCRGADEIYCSRCGHRVNVIGWILDYITEHRYCPQCGERMHNCDRYPHLIEVTDENDTDRIFIKAMGVRDDELTEEEKFVIRRSEDYVHKRDRGRDAATIAAILKDLEIMSRIEGMPDAAMKIIEKWIGE